MYHVVRGGAVAHPTPAAKERVLLFVLREGIFFDASAEHSPDQVAADLVVELVVVVLGEATSGNVVLGEAAWGNVVPVVRGGVSTAVQPKGEGEVASDLEEAPPLTLRALPCR